MTPRENMLALYRRQGYAFAPVEFDMCPALAQKMEAAIGKGVNPADYFDYPEGFARAGMPWVARIPRKEPDWRQYFTQTLHAETGFGDYGIAYEGGYQGANHFQRMHHPLAAADSLAQFQAYPWPEWDFENIQHMTSAAEVAHCKGYSVKADMACTIWETAWYIRDMAQLMTDMADEDEKATFLLDKITRDSTRRAASFARAGADIIAMGDDIGMQSTIMMSLEMYRHWLKPRLATVIRAAKAAKPDVLIQYHSCGYIEPFIPDLIEAGVDILNPIQPECMDFTNIYAEYGSQLSFNGTIGTQTTMPFGTPAEVRRVTLRNLELAGAKGGLLACPTHLLEPEVPWENVEAYVRACKAFSGGATG